MADWLARDLTTGGELAVRRQERGWLREGGWWEDGWLRGACSQWEAVEWRGPSHREATGDTGIVGGTANRPSGFHWDLQGVCAAPATGESEW